MSAINFVTSNGAVVVQRGSALSNNSLNDVIAPSGRDISLNLSPSDLRSYARSGADLQITLADGRVIIVQGYFAETASGEAHRLFVSADGALNEVLLQDGGDGILYANYSSAGNWGKWSPSDELIFVDRPDVAVAGGPVVDDEVSMLGAPLLGGLMGAGGGLGGLAAVGGAAVVAGLAGGGSASGGNGNGNGPAAPTVDTTPIVIGGDDARNGDPKITVTGTAVPGEVVKVVIGDKEVETTTGDDGTWTADFTGTHFPVDGGYQAAVTVTTATGDVDLSGPQITIDLTPPVLGMESGVVSTDDLFNAETHEDGVTLTGTGEAGATVDVTIRDVTHSTTVAADGTWSVDFTTIEVEAGEYIETVTVVSRDSYGNSTTLTDQIDIDTVPNPITIDGNSVGGDGTVNMTERDGGISITGTSRAGATLIVTVFDVAHEVTADAAGGWTVNLAADDVPVGTYDVTVTATSVDRAGNSNTVTGDFHVDTENSVSISAAPVAGDDVVNHAEADAGLTLTGQTDAGSTVSVTIGAVTHSATVAADGSWTVDFAGTDLPADGSATVVAVATDAAGNTVSDSRDIVIDRVSGVTVDTGDFGGDAVVNAAEAAAGITLSGTTDPGSTVEVTFNGSTYTASVDASGVWTVPIAAANVPTGEDSHDVIAVATDAAGNTASATGSVTVDTIAHVAITDDAVLYDDNVINATEKTNGITLTGSSEPGTTQVTVRFGSTERSAAVAANGTWSVDFAGAEIPADGTAMFSATAIDAAGNISAVDTRSIEIDTAVVPLTAENPADSASGIIVSREELDAGLTMNGTVEVGSSVTLSYAGETYTASVDALGNWSATLPAGAFAGFEGNAPITIQATDAAGNTAETIQTVAVDTVVPEGVETTGVSFRTGTRMVKDIDLDGDQSGASFARVEGDGTLTDLNLADSAKRFDGMETEISFTPGTVSDGTHLVVTTEDAAGNTSGTYLVVSSNTGNIDIDLSNPALAGYEVETLDLSATKGSLTITEADLKALSTNSDTLTIHGDAADQVEIIGAVKGGSSEGYTSYTLGDATLLIDDDIVNAGGVAII